MMDEKEIMPYNFFKYGGVYTGEHHGMRYLIKNTLRRDLKPLNEPFMKNRRLSTDKNVRKKMPLLVQVPVLKALHRVLYL